MGKKDTQFPHVWCRSLGPDGNWENIVLAQIMVQEPHFIFHTLLQSAFVLFTLSNYGVFLSHNDVS